MIRITHAYCEELGKTVTITQARRGFFSADPPCNEFHFFCDSEACKNNAVRISAVNYRVLPKDEQQYKVAHFKRLDTHIKGCDWEAVEVSVEPRDPQSKRVLRAKLTDMIDIFDPTPKSSDARPPPTSRAAAAANGTVYRTRNRGPASSSSNPGKTQTRDFERLVDCYLEARGKLSRKEFHSLWLEVVGTGQVRLATFFRHVTSEKAGMGTIGALYGGARFERHYPSGIRLHFFDDIDGKELKLFIPKSKLDAYRYRRYLLAPIEAEKTDGGYLTVFAFGNIVTSSFNHLSLDVPDLQNLVIRRKSGAANRRSDGEASST